VAFPMRHAITGLGTSRGTVSYQWRRAGTWEGVRLHVSASPFTPDESSEESFITEHYWGYARQRDGGTVEYQVEHPRWRVWRASAAVLECDADSLYGAEFSRVLSGQISTAFLAEGSPVIVRQGRRLG